MIAEMDLDFESCYQATRSRDPRFDGWFIVGVRTTGIYCRPSCPSPVCPKPANVTFYRTAAAAQLAGLRACKRCRPDAAPGSAEWNSRADVVGRAMRLIADGVIDREGVPGLARQLAVSVRHLHRLLVDAVGAPPLALARSQRAYQARLLVETTRMPFGEVAFAAGFSSIRQFNDTLREIFDATPSQLRAAVRRRGAPHPGGLTLRLALRQPYDPHGVVEWLAARALPGIEEYAHRAYRRVLRLPGGPGTVTLHPTPDHVHATLRLATVADLGSAVARCRRLLDLDADPGSYLPVLATDPALAPLAEATPGLRLPGTVDGAETALRTVLGPHAQTLVAALAEPLPGPDGGLTHTFPGPAAIAAADLAMPAARASTVREMAQQLATGELRLDEGADRVEVRRGLLAVPGLGPAQVEDLMLHALGDPDSFPAADHSLRSAAGAHQLPADAAGLTRRANQWRPWRGYGAHLLWRAESTSVLPGNPQLARGR
ncbi:DNA-3-methyladenine glycosylase 2 family protein [Actinopolymorpha rutila]|uniref:DNA-3-methyladenine glycosylase II n=1 Tax=Actinopolymorpha rutila TaxID=446787 RepID=A0A852Z8E5_9ACTN|nr:AlkA N-terminal domain-containing protein [Actinopolymorpha rutila]NYH89224.1 AraC family transcriptional regulator of adaptative response / DNA-3-methyladenine glycosylase II [Actinopolymorpha rutila]